MKDTFINYKRGENLMFSPLFISIRLHFPSSIPNNREFQHKNCKTLFTLHQSILII